MAEIIEMGENGEEGMSHEMSSKEKALVSWVMGRVRPWEDYRNSNFKEKWDEYYRLFRGI